MRRVAAHIIYRNKKCYYHSHYLQERDMLLLHIIYRYKTCYYHSHYLQERDMLLLTLSTGSKHVSTHIIYWNKTLGTEYSRDLMFYLMFQVLASGPFVVFCEYILF